LTELFACFRELFWHSPCSGKGVPRAVPVAIVLTRFEPGGTERQMIELVRRLDPARWSVQLACFETRGAWLSRAAAGASISEFPVRSFKRLEVLGNLWAFARWCRERRIAIVHTSELYSNIFGLLGAALAGVPVRIGNRREINPDKSTAQIAAQRAAYGCAHLVVANSQAAADRLMTERVPASKIAVVPNGVDFEPFGARIASRRPRKVAIVANLRPEKGHDVLIDAAVQVLARIPDARFEVVGGGPQLNTLLARCEARQVRHAFTFVGHQEDVAARLTAADIFALPSRSEAFPNAVLEAMAASLPVVASGVGGIRELIDDGRTGLLVAAGDSGALAERLLRLMTEPGLAARLGDAARIAAQTRYSFDRMVAAFDALYTAELTRRGVAVGEQLELAAS
jgi:glycosyltransferase involved in cell wall biosynthesis